MGTAAKGWVLSMTPVRYSAHALELGLHGALSQEDTLMAHVQEYPLGHKAE